MLLKTYFRFLDQFFPSLAAQQMYQVMSNPKVRKLRDFEEEILNQSQKEVIAFRNFEIQTYTWGPATGKVILMVHGWEGQAGNFGALVDLFLEKGYQVVAFDGPAHGHSTKAPTNMFEFGDFVSLMLQKHRPEYVISHSFGSVTTAGAIRRNPDIPIKQWIMVTTPYQFKDRVEDIKIQLGVSDRTIHRLKKKIEADTQEKLEDLSMATYSPDLHHVDQLLIVHSKTDRILPIQAARKVNEVLPQSELIELDQLGHYGILWSEDLKEIIKTRVN
ncbi:MAG: alpha/beta hydrolase [Bacteroidota bacterium]